MNSLLKQALKAPKDDDYISHMAERLGCIRCATDDNEGLYLELIAIFCEQPIERTYQDVVQALRSKDALVQCAFCKKLTPRFESHIYENGEVSCSECHEYSTSISESDEYEYRVAKCGR